MYALKSQDQGLIIPPSRHGYYLTILVEELIVLGLLCCKHQTNLIE
jgi:hypothetical protein